MLIGFDPHLNAVQVFGPDSDLGTIIRIPEASREVDIPAVGNRLDADV